MFNITNILLYILQWEGPDLFYWFQTHERLQDITFLTLHEKQCGSQSHKKNQKGNDLRGRDDGFGSFLGKTCSFADVRTTAAHSPQLF